MEAAEPLASRSDARRNRTRLLEAAREALASDGVDVPVRDIARRAGVGVGTLYRHFPTREDLVDAVLEDTFDEYVALAEEALGAPDGWSGFTGFLERALALHARNRGLREVVETRAHGRAHAEAMRRRMAPLLARLVERAQAEGTLRRDLLPQDVALIFWGADRVMELAGPVAPGAWRRQLGLLLDGLRSSAATPLPQPPLTAAQEQRLGAIHGMQAARA
jgi:AcrR family transcriptional regulator